MENFRMNEGAKRFELDVDQQMAIIDYHIKEGKIYLTHTEVPKELQGKGIGSQIVSKTLEHLKSINQKVVPTCTFVAAFVARHPEYQSIITS